MKRILIIGGTRFVGRNLIEKLLPLDKYDITLFNRGKTNPDIFQEIKRIKGDRKKESDLRLLAAKDWDVVIDISGYWAEPLATQLSLQKGKVGRYIYVSTSSHYQFDPQNPHLIKEDEAIVSCSLEERKSEERKHYNQNKAECERILAQQEDLDYIILRPGLIIGKYDYTDRLYYWFHKAKTQEEILVANGGENFISFTNVEDLAEAIITAIEIDNKEKIFNCSSFNASISDFLTLIGKKLDKKINLVSATADFLTTNGVKQWSSLPLWLNGNFLTIDNSRIQSAFQMEFISLEKTVEDLIQFYSSEKKWAIPNPTPPALSRQEEIDLIAKISST